MQVREPNPQRRIIIDFIHESFDLFYSYKPNLRFWGNLNFKLYSSKIYTIQMDSTGLGLSGRPQHDPAGEGGGGSDDVLV